MKGLRTGASIILLAGTTSGSRAVAMDRSAAIRAAIRAPQVSVNYGFYFTYNLVDCPAESWSPGPLSSLAERTAAEAALNKGQRSARTFYDLGSACQGLGDETAGRQYLERAADLYAKQWRRSKSQTALRGRAMSLIALGRLDTAEKLLRVALRDDPHQWMGWLALDNALVERSSHDLLADTMDQVPATLSSRLLMDNWAEVLERIREVKPSAAKVAHVQSELGAATASFERAEKVAPRSPWPRFMNAMFITYTQPTLTAAIEVARGGAPPDDSALENISAGLPEFEKAAQLHPGDYRLPVFVAIQQMSVIENKEGYENWNHAPWSARKLIQKCIDRLRQIGAGKDPIAGAGAFDGLGLIRMNLKGGSPAAGAPSFRRALARNANDACADTLILAGLEDTRRFADGRDFCSQRIKIHPTALLWFLRGLFDMHLKDFSAAERDERAALKLVPNGFDTNITLAALILKDRSDPGSIAEARKLLDTAQQIGAEEPSSDHRLSYQLVDGAYLALTGKADDARAQIEAVAQNNTSSKDAATAKGLLLAIGD